MPRKTPPKRRKRGRPPTGVRTPVRVLYVELYDEEEADMLDEAVRASQSVSACVVTASAWVRQAIRDLSTSGTVLTIDASRQIVNKPLNATSDGVDSGLDPKGDRHGEQDHEA